MSGSLSSGLTSAGSAAGQVGLSPVSPGALGATGGISGAAAAGGDAIAAVGTAASAGGLPGIAAAGGGAAGGIGNITNTANFTGVSTTSVSGTGHTGFSATGSALDAANAGTNQGGIGTTMSNALTANEHVTGGLTESLAPAHAPVPQTPLDAANSGAGGGVNVGHDPLSSALAGGGAAPSWTPSAPADPHSTGLPDHSADPGATGWDSVGGAFGGQTQAPAPDAHAGAPNLGLTTPDTHLSDPNTGGTAPDTSGLHDGGLSGGVSAPTTDAPHLDSHLPSVGFTDHGFMH